MRPARSRMKSCVNLAMPDTGDCWSSRSTAVRGASMRQFAGMITQMATIDPTVAGLASVHGCIGAVDPVRSFGSPEQKRRFLPKLANGTSTFGIRVDRTGRRKRSDGAEDDSRAGRGSLRRQWRKAVHHQRGARTHDWSGLQDRRCAQRARRRSSRNEKTRHFGLNRYGIYALRRAHNNGLVFTQLSRPGREPADADSRRRSDDRLPRIEPRTRFAVCQCRRHDALDARGDACRGPDTARRTARRLSVANWYGVASGEWPD